MEKIFDKDFRNELFHCLKESGMKDKEVSSIIKKTLQGGIEECCC